uniref:Lipoprotein cytochrome c n=1 Tax=Geobacter metallireducens TaxID=28232 RepID=A0A831XDT9_GEOME
MIRTVVKACLAMALLAGCGGGMNSSNPEAPKANQAHEATWVTYHRGSLLDFANYTTATANGEIVVDGIIINEISHQCRVCHGPSLAGRREGYKGSDCLSCHVLDPVKYPVMCYSCHGGWAIVPFAGYTTGAASGQPTPIILSLKQNGWPVSPLQKWFSTARSRRGDIPYDPSFVERVRSGTSIHRKHVAIESYRYNATLYFNALESSKECTTCHGSTAYGTTLGTGRHHNYIGKTVKIDPATGYVVMPDNQGGREDLVDLYITPPGCAGPLYPPGPFGPGCHSFSSSSGGFSLVMDCVACHGKPH